MFDPAQLNQVLILLTVIGIDLALSADNAVVIGLAAAPLPDDRRGKVIAIGTLAAALLRILLAILAVELLGIIGLVLAGGMLLLYVAWKLWWDLKGSHSSPPHPIDPGAGSNWNRRQFAQAIVRIVIADVSLSVDNILAVAGAARNHMQILIVGLVLSVLLTGIAASMVARIVDRYRWINHLGIAMIVWVGVRMIWDGSLDVLTHLGISTSHL